VLEELRDQLLLVRVSVRKGHFCKRRLECRPIRHSVLLGQGVLDVAQPRLSGGIVIDTTQSFLRLRFVTAQGAEPAFRFLPQILQARTRGELAIHGIFLPLLPGVR
jgi:hypothetical protein